jgi:glycerol-3-phosphate dehydrogenase (NAD(P)+)
MSAAVGVVGGGRWGVALACAARRNGGEVLLHSRREVGPEAAALGVELTQDLRAVASRCDLVVIAAPSDVVRDVARALGEVIDGSHLVVHGVRGLSGEGLTPISEVIRAETPCRRVGALGGPAVADDLLHGRPGIIAVASRFPEVTARFVSAYGGPALRVSVSHDLTGLEWASALNGCLFVALGFAREVGISPGLVAGVLTRGLAEATRLAVAAGAEEKTLHGVVGLGDLLAAMGADERPEVRLGALLAQGVPLTEAQSQVGTRVEAVTLLPRLTAFAKERRVEATLFGAIGGVLNGALNVDALYEKLMAR